ncbi:hypothetical protein SAMN04488038_10355 [Solimonas aquatica]|uniref:Uncharacterized protein n=1 Tax=Solimonas aquatica TaxID=489703 RepID=A0A1H9CH88_9GAMM|nr:hypothetical protein [Solimonas aquatica]SEQ00600.1 hypothetical protein SAMN04488038_10355 [Solimonas aquatica]
MRAMAATAALLLAAVCAAAAAADLDLRVRYESEAVDAAAVHKREQWQDRLIVREGHVWTQRIIDARLPAHGGQEQHAHFDFALAAQHLRRGEKGELIAEYVDTRSRTVVFVPAAEYAAVGFDGSWEAAAALLPPAVVKRMPVLVRTAPAGCSWREERRQGRYTRVLWDERGGYARRIETGREDGVERQLIVAEPMPAVADAALPWRELAGYQHKEYDDFMD